MIDKISNIIVYCSLLGLMGLGCGFFFEAFFNVLRGLFKSAKKLFFHIFQKNEKLDYFYTKRLLKELSTRNNAEDIKNLKDPQKEGERK